jgi:hypothetical protein
VKTTKVLRLLAWAASGFAQLVESQEAAKSVNALERRLVDVATGRKVCPVQNESQAETAITKLRHALAYQHEVIEKGTRENVRLRQEMKSLELQLANALERLAPPAAMSQEAPEP